MTRQTTPMVIGLRTRPHRATAAGSATAEWGLNLPVGVSPIANEAYSLHMLILWICVAIGVVVFGVMFYSIIKHRKKQQCALAVDAAEGAFADKGTETKEISHHSESAIWWAAARVTSPETTRGVAA